MCLLPPPGQSPRGSCEAKACAWRRCCVFLHAAYLRVSMEVHVRDGSRQHPLTRRSYAFALTCCVLTRELGCDGLPQFWARRRLGGDGREEHVGPLLGRYFCRGACPARPCFVITSRRRRVACRFHFHDSRSLWLRRLSACELRTLAVRRLRSRLAWRSRTGRRYMQSSCARDRMRCGDLRVWCARRRCALPDCFASAPDRDLSRLLGRQRHVGLTHYCCL